MLRTSLCALTTKTFNIHKVLYSRLPKNLASSFDRKPHKISTTNHSVDLVAEPNWAEKSFVSTAFQCVDLRAYIFMEFC